ncbi:MAG: hypothetical protein ACI9LM_000413 [Alteromonadaceae bacterium]|jgi:hypothetical protein
MVLFVSMLTIMFTAKSNAANAEVTWTNSDKYQDIRSGFDNRKRFKKRTFKSFEKHFSGLADQLPQGLLLKIDVIDVDLAGDMGFHSDRQVRVVKDIYFPRLKFSYELFNVDKSLVTSGDINLKDMSFMLSNNLRYRNKALGYEKRMLDNWFNDTFRNMVASD